MLFTTVSTFSLLFGALIEIAEKGDFGCDRVPDANGSFTNSSIVMVGNETIDCYLRDSSWQYTDSDGATHMPCLGCLGFYVGANGASTAFDSIPKVMYWCMVTMTTVGYVDQFPITALGYMVGSITILAGLISLALPVTIISANFDEQTREHKRQGAAEMAKSAALQVGISTRSIVQQASRVASFHQCAATPQSSLRGTAHALYTWLCTHSCVHRGPRSICP